MNTISSRITSSQRRPQRLAALLTLLMSTACAFDSQAPLEEDVESHDSAITNAYIDGPGYIVNFGGCSGSVIAPNYIVTAAHCFNRTAPFAVTVRSGLYSETIAYSGTADVVVHPNWSPNASDRVSWDIALVHLWNTGVGTNFPRALVYGGPEAPWTSRGGTFYISGYGRGSDPGGSKNCSGADSGGILKRGANFAFLGTGAKSGSTWLTSDSYSSLRSTCGGDSGAPYVLPRNGTDFIFGVHSSSANVANGTIRGPLLAAKMDWILNTAAGLGAPMSCPFVRDHRTSPSMYYWRCS